MLSWQDFLKEESKKEYFKKLIDTVNFLYKEKKIEPRKENVYRVFNMPINNIKVVILGQDPYPGIGIATGLAFATNNNIMTKSLNNIFVNIKKFENISNINTDLLNLERQGVFLLNRNLITEVGKPKALSNIGFEILTENVIKYINNNLSNIVFILWGMDAVSIEHLINKEKHFIIKSTHPSPLSFSRSTKTLEAFINVPFTKLCNEYLKKYNKEEIVWKT